MKKRVIRLICLALVAVMTLFAVGCDALLDSSLLEDPTWQSLNLDNKDTHSNSENHTDAVENKDTENNKEDGKDQNGDQSNEDNKIPFPDDGGIDPDNTEKTNQYGDPTFESAVPVNELDFDCEEIAILYRDFIHNSREWYKASPEDELDEAIAMRNDAVQAALNIKIVWEPVASNGRDYSEYTARFHNMVTTDVITRMHYYDISANFGYPTTSPNIRDYTTNLLDKDLFPYFDFTLPCWNQSLVNNTTCDDQLYYVAGDINLSMFDAAGVVWYNWDLYKQEYVPGTDPEDLQELALNGKWTYDELYRWTSVFYKNTNTANQGRDNNDTYALIANYDTSSVIIDSLPYAWDLDFVTTGITGAHLFNIVGNTKIEDALVKCRTILNGEGTCATAGIHNFAEGNAIFFMDRLYADYSTNMRMREMDDKYGLLPMPKYDTNQKNYATTAQDYFTLMFVLNHSESNIPTKGEAVSAFLQYATEMSYDSVRGYYFNRIIKPKFFGNDDSEGTVSRSAALFDIIVKNVEFDFMTIYSPHLNNISHLWRNACRPGNSDTVEQLYNNQKETFNRALLDVDRWLGLR